MTEPAIDTGEILEALNDKVDRDCRNVDTTSGADAVIEYQIPTAANNYTWYRKYKSGWVEQGGYKNNNENVVNLIITMTDTNYWVEIQPQSNSTTSFQARSTHVSSKTTTSVTYTGLDDPAYWQVKGMSAQS